MNYLSRYLILLFRLLLIFEIAEGNTYSVRIETEQHVNVVDEKFLSFTIDPKYLFASDGKHSGQESVCMASSLTPALLRIAGPSTATMTFHNTTISFTDLNGFEAQEDQDLKVSNTQWKKFIDWAKDTGFELVFALNNERKTRSGLWDPNTALNVLTMAEKTGVQDFYWQLGYECRNQSIEEYLGDLETLRVIVETFPEGERHRWKVVGGDVTHCLQKDSKSDFKDYVTLSDDMLDAVLLHGDSSAQELERMTEADRQKLLQRLSVSPTPLWLTESPHTPAAFSESEELARAVDWMASLGYSARNGFSVHFRELVEQELYQPTLSFYMALLYKNLVGERVLQLDMKASQAVLFAHCTSLRHIAVEGAVTLYGANLDDEPARFSVKLTRKEHGGDVLQFVLGHDRNGNIIVNGHPMFYEGDIRPVVKRLRPYKTLLLTLPPRSFGFWVLFNTNIEACYNIDANENDELVEALTVNMDEFETQSDEAKTEILEKVEKVKKDVIQTTTAVPIVETATLSDLNQTSIENESKEGLEERIKKLNTDIKNAHILLDTPAKNNKNKILERSKRQLVDKGRRRRQRMNRYKSILGRKNFDEVRPKFELIRKYFGWNTNTRTGLATLNRPARKRSKFVKSKARYAENEITPIGKSTDIILQNQHETVVDRKRRSISEPERKTEIRNFKTRKDTIYDSAENDVDIDDRDNAKITKIKNIKTGKDATYDSAEIDVDIDDKHNAKILKVLQKIHKELKELPSRDTDYQDYESDSKNGDESIMSSLLDHDSNEHDGNSKKGLLKSTMSKIVGVLDDLNTNLSKFWNVIRILD